MKEGWEIIDLGSVCHVQRGLTYSGKDTVDISDQVVLRATNIDLGTGKLIFDELKYLREDLEIKPVYALKKDSLLICFSSGSKSHLGKIALVDDDYPNFFFGGFIGQINPSEKIDSKYLFYCLSSETYKDYISNLTDGVNINNLKATDLKSFQIPLPPLPEQQRIVSILDKAFAAIDKAKANAEQNLQNAKELFESYLQGVFEKKGKGWEEKTLLDVVHQDCKLSYGIVQPGKDFENGLPVVRPTDLTTRYISKDGLKLINPKLAEGYSRTKLIGDELLLCVRGSTGVLSIATSELKGANVTRGIVPIRFNTELIDQGFGYYLLISNYVQYQIKEKTYGAALMQINIGDLRKIETPYPKIEEQQTIGRQLDALRAETQMLETVYQKKMDDLEELKKSILKKAFTGELENETSASSVTKEKAEINM